MSAHDASSWIVMVSTHHGRHLRRPLRHACLRSTRADVMIPSSTERCALPGIVFAQELCLSSDAQDSRLWSVGCLDRRWIRRHPLNPADLGDIGHHLCPGPPSGPGVGRRRRCHAAHAVIADDTRPPLLGIHAVGLGMHDGRALRSSSMLATRCHFLHRMGLMSDGIHFSPKDSRRAFARHASGIWRVVSAR